MNPFQFLLRGFAMNLRSLFSRTASTCLLLTLAACGGGGGNSSSAASSFTIGGTLTGLAPGRQVTLNNNASDPLTLTADGTFTFPTAVAFNGSYAVTVATQPTDQTCTVAGGSGAGVVAGISTVAVTCSTNVNAGVVTTLAGTGSIGSTNGTGTAASFNLPYGIAVDASGTVYVADTHNNLIRKITAAGVVTTLAGTGSSGSTDGTGTAASFDEPVGVAVDSSGTVYVADAGNHLIRKITAAGVVTTLAGSGSSGSMVVFANCSGSCKEPVLSGRYGERGPVRGRFGRGGSDGEGQDQPPGFRE